MQNERKGGVDVLSLNEMIFHGNTFGEKISEELLNKIAFNIPVPGTDFKIPVSESVVGTWIVMAVLLVASIIMTSNLSVVPTTKRQVALEIFIGWLDNFFTGILGRQGKRYIPYLMTVIIFIGAANISGIFGLPSPTRDLGVTAGLALMSIILIEYSTFAARGTKGFFKSFAEPNPLMLPINIMEIGIRPLSLCMRLFGNVLGSYVIMELIELAVRGIKPITLPLSFYFDIFDGFIQAYVFVFLTAMFMAEGFLPEKKK